MEVRWLETSDSFSGQITGIVPQLSGESVYEVEYDEKIKDKTCRESNVAADRLKLRVDMPITISEVDDDKNTLSIIDRLTLIEHASEVIQDAYHFIYNHLNLMLTYLCMSRTRVRTCRQWKSG